MIVPALSSVRFIGRSEELRTLHEARRALSSGRGSVVLIGGDAGIGKTRLLSEFAAALTGGRAPRFALGECLADAPRPFGPFRVVLGALVSANPESLDAAPRIARRALAALVSDLREADEATAQSPHAIEKAELFSGVLTFLQSIAAARAVVLALEDLHWADSATIELLRYVAPRIGGSRILLVATHRADVEAAHPLAAALPRLARERTVCRMALDPFAESETRALIDEALGKKYQLAPSEIRDVMVKAEGNPFFTEELLKKALERSAVDERSSLPISIRAVVSDRTAALSAGERDVLENAAVLGQEFDVRLLALLTRRDERDVLRAIRRFRDLNLIAEVPTARGRFRFRHALTRQTIYEDLMSVDVRSLHEHIVRSLESAGASSRNVDELAYHAWKAELPAQTLRYSELAGDAALGVRAAHQAATYFERAITAATDNETRIRLLGKAGEAYVQASAFEEAAVACIAQHDLLIPAGRYDEAARALTRAAGERANGGDATEAFALIDAFLARYGERLSQTTRDHVHASLGRMATARDDYETARAVLAKVRNPASLPAFTHQVYWLAQLFVAQEDVDKTAWLTAAAALRARNGETYPLMRSQMLHSIAETATTFAANALGAETVDEAIAIDREYGFVRALAFASAVKASILTLEGRLNEARTSIEAALAEADAIVIGVQLAVGACATPIALADETLARRCLPDSIFERLGELGALPLQNAMAAMRAAMLFANGAAAEARPLLERAIDGPQHQIAVVNVWPIASKYLDLPRLDRLRALCVNRAANRDDVVARACAALLDAVAAKRRGDRAAKELAATAAARYAELGWPVHQAYALELGERIDAAIELHRHCGNVTDLRRLELPASSPGGRPRGKLSPREHEVAGLIAQGFTNRAIAQKLCVGEKTVEKYVTAIYAKLNFTTRTQLAAHVARAQASL